MHFSRLYFHLSETVGLPVLWPAILFGFWQLSAQQQCCQVSNLVMHVKQDERFTRVGSDKALHAGACSCLARFAGAGHADCARLSVMVAKYASTSENFSCRILSTRSGRGLPKANSSSCEMLTAPREFPPAATNSESAETTVPPFLIVEAFQSLANTLRRSGKEPCSLRFFW